VTGPNVTRRLLLLLAATAVLTAACADLPEAEVSFGEGVTFVPQVADSLDDVGLGNAVAVNADGQPFVSYFGFPFTEGPVAAVRPINSAFLPAVQLTTVQDGIFVRGAVAQVQDPPAPQYVVPFGGTAVDALEEAAPENTNGTAIAIAPDGTGHVAWSAPDGVWYSSGTDGFSAEQVEPYEPALSQAGPLGRPSLTLDGAGNPWIAYQVVAGGRVEVRVATPGADGWDVQVAATAPLCNACPPIGAAPIMVLNDAPVVAFADHDAGDLKQAVLNGQDWQVSVGIPGVEALGLSAVSDGDTAYLAYYADGAARVASSNGASWSPSDVADADLGDAAGERGNLAPTTGLALDEQGTVYVAWQDADGVHMASGDGSAFEPAETRDTDGGVTPSIAVTADASSVYLSWYDPDRLDLMLGVLGEAGDIVLANPSPIPPPEAAPPQVEGCGDDGQIDLEIAALNVVFDKNCLVAPADEAFTITFDNQEAVPHNIAVFEEQGGALIDGTEVATGPVVQELRMEPLPADSYFFHCDVHPTTMTGTLAVIEGGGGGGGNVGNGEGEAAPADEG
jgi:plastocyanin